MESSETPVPINRTHGA